MKQERVLLAHGGGGKLTQQLIEEIIYPAFNQNGGHRLLDSALINVDKGKVALTTDSFVISPIFFPGGDIGKLAACGTINDLAVVGAAPLVLSVGLIIEEGLLITELQRILHSLAAAAAGAGVSVVTGDTKVVERGHADGIYINTTGLGTVAPGVNLDPQQITAGDLIIVSGSIGEHGMAVLSKREGIAFTSSIISDCAALNGLTGAVLEAGGVSCMRDPTRGGVATTLLELAEQSQTLMEIVEEDIPIKSPVVAGCEMLGLDPLYLANEGKLILIIKPDKKEAVLSGLKNHPLGGEAAVIGQVVSEHPQGKLLLVNSIGSKRIITKMEGRMLPRIC